jgi:PAS domain S-box-containing protein
MRVQVAKRPWHEYQALFETLSDGLIHLDAHGVVLTFNMPAQSLFTRLLPSASPLKLAIGQPFVLPARDMQGRFFTDETAPIAGILRGEAIAAARAVLVRCATREGRDLYLRISGSPLYNERNDSTSKDKESTTGECIIVLRDVTEITQRRRYLDEMVLQGAIEQRRQRVREERALRISPLMSDYAYAYQILPDYSIKRDWITEAFEHITGYTLEELDASSDEQKMLCHPDDRAQIDKHMAAMWAGTSDVREWRIITKKGDVRWLRYSSHPARDENSGIIHVYGACHDITEQKKVEQQASNLTQQLSATFEAITDGILIYDREGHLLQTNSVARDLLPFYALRPEQSSSLPAWMEAMHFRDESRRSLALTDLPQYRVLHGEVLQGTQAVDILVTVADGRDLYLNISGSPVRNTLGEQIGAVLILRDVTERRQYEQWMQKALQSLFAMTEAIVQFPEEFELPDEAADEASYSARQQVIYHLLSLSCELLGSKTACIIAIDAQTEQLLPIATSGFLASQREQFEAELSRFRLEDYFQQQERALLLHGEVVLVEPDQLPMPALTMFGLQQVLVAPLRIGERTQGMVWLDYNVADQGYSLHQAMELFKVVGSLAALVIERERLIHERIIAQAKALAESETNRQKDEFLSLTSYELRTPLAAIKASLQLTSRQIRSMRHDIDLTAIIEQVDEILGRGERQVAVESRLIGDLLDISHNQERLALKMKLCNLLDIVNNVVADVRSSNTAREISVNVINTQHQDRQEQATIDMVPIIADTERIGQVLTNYLNNAIKYSPADEPIRIRLECEESQARVCVIDKGQGMIFTEQLKIWERFYQIPNRIIYSGSSGLGLGLALCRTIIEQHDGQVGVESELGHGSRFWFTLPLAHESLQEEMQ